MRRFKEMVIKTINRDLLDIYKHLNPTTADFSFVIHLCESMSAQKKNKFSENLAKKLEKEHSNREYLNLLILCDFLSATKPELLPQFPHKMLTLLTQRNKIKCVSKEQKLELAETSYLHFYLEYLKQKLWGSHIVEDLSLNNLNQGLTYSESSLNALKLVIRHDFIAEFVLTNSEFNNQIKISMENILRRSSEDLNFVIKFVQKWSQIIVNGEAHSISMNDVYEQLIFVNKNISKLEYLNKKINGNIKFRKYEFNKKLNLQIEKSMIPRQSERKSFYSMKRLKTEGDHCNENQQRMQEQITQSEIYMKFKM